MAFITSSLLTDLFTVIVVLCGLLVAYVKFSYTYWSRRNIPYIEPRFPMGNVTTVFPRGISFGTISRKFYVELKRRGCKLGGIYAVLQPHLVITDPEYVKNILARDFKYFVDRGIYKNKKHEPIMANILSLDGDEWKRRRTKLSPTFTSQKMKNMFSSVIQCSHLLKQGLEKLAVQKVDVDIHEEAGRYTTDVIGYTVFGMEFNSLKNPNADFRLIGKKALTEFSTWMGINLFLAIYFPSIAMHLGVRSLQKEVEDFFCASLKETVKYREDNQIRRQDFLQILIDLKNTQNINEKITMDELYAEAALFFVAGFESSSKTMAQVLFHLGQNQEAQDRLRNEICEVLGKYNNEVTYENLGEMKYLQQVFDETLRLWPILATLNRVCTKDYTFDNSNTKIEKGTRIMIPVLGFHHDPDYFPEPDKWDPERFSSENRKNIDSRIYLPFGDGPRNCLGLRFGTMQTKIGIVTVIKNFRVTVSPSTKLPLGLDPDTFVSRTLNTVYLRLEKI